MAKALGRKGVGAQRTAKQEAPLSLVNIHYSAITYHAFISVCKLSAASNTNTSNSSLRGRSPRAHRTASADRSLAYTNRVMYALFTLIASDPRQPIHHQGQTARGRVMLIETD